MASTSTIDVFISTFTGLRPFALPSVPSSTPLSGVLSLITESLPSTVAENVYFTQYSGRLLPSDSTLPISALVPSDTSHFLLRVTARLRGGKGGFGSQLRAQGGRMSARRKRGVKNDEDQDNYRNLDGRRMRSIRQAKDLAIYLETAPQRIKEAARQKRERLKAIIEMEDPASKARFDDVEFLEESEEMIEDLKRIVEDSVKYGGQRFVLSSSDDEEDEDDEGEGKGDTPKFVVGSADSGESSSSSASREPKFASFFDEDVDNDVSDDSDDDKSASK
ncbi:telomere stability and silencing-domain-containing protein [Lipomyces tetrasporus]|uniref:Telomere stability and silencing-domain-containing protein n=1 Tax=Lipomyces tetrasporus TaxID=54092 RepID=A0AAD7VRG6_9ASCO|nr:telomere stability and silencing-domain-containing protein [Lipomyces tetrasporus]KAJ8100027.1 telomere stability and silencing-domain-containing protein [Lipomyces tetrasporus]